MSKKVYVINKPITLSTKAGRKKLGDTIKASDIGESRLKQLIKEEVLINEDTAMKIKKDAEAESKKAKASFEEVRKMEEAVKSAQEALVKDKEEFEKEKESFRKEKESFESEKIKLEESQK